MENVEYKYPDKEKLQDEYLKKYGEEFLKLNNLKLGDIITIKFTYEEVKSQYKSRKLERYTSNKLANGILKSNEKGLLYAESIEDMEFYHHCSNGLSGRSNRTWYKKVMKKSIHKFGTGFIYRK
jgi:hypothetical protein